MSSKKPFTVYFIPKTHHDLGYTHTIDALLDAYCQYYDDVLDFCDKTASYPWEAQYRYTVESFWSLDYYLKHTTEKNRVRMKRYVQSKRIEIQAFYANVIDGICSEEEIARLMYPSFAYAKECGVKIVSAALTDIPGMSAGLIKALTDAKIPYLFAGFPTYFEWGDANKDPLPMTKSFWDEETLFGREHPIAFHWRALTGKRIFTWYQYGYGYMGKDSEPLFEADDYETLEANLPQYVASLREKTPYTVMRYVDHGMDNVPPSMALCDVVRQWNQTHEDIRCVVATESMFFDALYADCEGTSIPEICGEMPHTDYTTLAFSESAMTALNARTKERLQVLERFDALSSLHTNETASPAPFTSLYSDVSLYDEHCFGMSKLGYRNQYNRCLKNSYALRAAWDTDTLWKTHFSPLTDEQTDPISLLCASGVKEAAVCSWIQYEKANEASVFGTGAFMTDSHRPVYVQCDAVDEAALPIPDLAEAYALRKPNTILRQYTASISEQDNLSLSSLHPSNDSSIPFTAICNDTFFENSYYRIDFDASRGGAYRVFDKELGKEITDSSCSFGGIFVKDIESNCLHTPTIQRMRHRRSGPVADSMVLYASAYAVPSIVTELTLYHTVKRIDVTHRILLDRTPLREVFSVFPFQIEQPKFSFQGIGTPIRAFDDVIAGANTNQYSAQHWCRTEGDGMSCVLAMSEARIVEFGGIHTTAVSQAHRQLSPVGFTDPYVKKEDLQKGHIVSMLAYNNCRTNFAPTQEGEVLYRYAVTSGKRVNAEAFAESFVYPPVLTPSELPSISVSLSPQNVTLSGFKRAENGDGYILRIRECVGKSTAFTVHFSDRQPTSVTKCTLLEDEIQLLPEDKRFIAPYETLTLRVRFKESY